MSAINRTEEWTKFDNSRHGPPDERVTRLALYLSYLYFCISDYYKADYNLSLFLEGCSAHRLSGMLSDLKAAGPGKGYTAIFTTAVEERQKKAERTWFDTALSVPWALVKSPFTVLRFSTEWITPDRAAAAFKKKVRARRSYPGCTEAKRYFNDRTRSAFGSLAKGTKSPLQKYIDTSNKQRYEDIPKNGTAEWALKQSIKEEGKDKGLDELEMKFLLSYLTVASEGAHEKKPPAAYAADAIGKSMRGAMMPSQRSYHPRYRH